jgi:predicted nucleic acid-binding protein
MPRNFLLLDTDIVSQIGRQRPPPGLREWLDALGPKRAAISFPVVAELRRGAHLLEKTYPMKATAISEWVDEVLGIGFRMLPMTPDAAAVYARMTSTPSLRHMWTVQRGAKQNRLGHDLMVASVAIAHDAPLLTANTKDYMRIHELFPLPGIYNPLRRVWNVMPCRDVELPAWESSPRLLNAPLPGIQGNDEIIVRC